MDISVMLENYKLNIRAAAIVENNGKILLHKNKNEEFYALPGGRIQLGEEAETTIKREFKEEMGIDVEIRKFRGIVENFFEMNEKQYHEYMILFEAQPKSNRIYGQSKVKGIEENSELEFIWEDINSLNELDLRPSNIKQSIIEKSPIVHVVQKD